MMEDKKLMARKNMLDQFRKSARGKIHEPFGKELAGKKALSITIEAPEGADMEDVMSQAEKLIAAKFGQKMGMHSPFSMKDEEMCPECHGIGCEMCEEMPMDEDSEEIIDL